MVRRRHIYLLCIFLLMGCWTRSFTPIPTQYVGWLGPSGEFSNSFRSDSGRGSTFSLLVITTPAKRNSKGAGCEDKKDEEWEEVSSTLDGPLPGVNPNNSERHNLRLSSQPPPFPGPFITTGSIYTSLWTWAFESKVNEYSQADLTDNTITTFDSLPPWPGQAAERLLIVRSKRESAPNNPNAAAWKPIALLREARFSRNSGMVYLDYWYYDQAGAVHEEKLLRAN